MREEDRQQLINESRNHNEQRSVHQLQRDDISQVTEQTQNQHSNNNNINNGGGSIMGGRNEVASLRSRNTNNHPR